MAKRGLSGIAIEAEYTITRPQASSATTTHSSAWSKPSTLAGVVPVARRYSVPPTRTGSTSPPWPVSAENHALVRCMKFP